MKPAARNPTPEVPTPDSPVSASLSLTLANRMDEVPRLVALLESFGARAGLSDDLTFRLTVTIDEAITNIIEHAYDDAASHDIGLSVTWDGTALTAVIEDDGRSFDPRQVPRPDVNAPLDERKSGGLGVYLVRTLVQDVDYRRAGSRNVLTLTLSDEGHGPPQDGHYGGRSA